MCFLRSAPKTIYLLFMKKLLILPIVAIVSIIIYYFIRIFFFFEADYNFWDSLFAVLLLIGETYMIIHAFGFMINVLKINGKKVPYRMKKLEDGEYPEVAVIVAAKHEPEEVLERTFITLKSMDYPNFKIYLLDGSTKSKFIDQNKNLVKKYGIHYFHPNEYHGAKAGIINDFIQNAYEKYLAVFDADQNPLPDFLKKVVSIAEYNKNIAFVQTPQFYSNIQSSPIAKGSTLQQAVFYESICEGKNTNNAMFCCGTNVLFRTDALREVGGFDETSITEDFATSVKLHTKGYKSVYYNHARVFGLAPESLAAYFKQQYRWSAGTVGVFKKLIYALIKNPRSLSLGQWWEYFLSSTYYLVGIAFFLLMISPIAYLIFNVPSYFVSPEVYIFTFVPYFVLTLLVFYGIMKKRKYKINEVYNGIILASVSFPILMQSVFLSLIGKKFTFDITPKGGTSKIPFIKLWPWTTMLILNSIAIYFGITKISNNQYAVGVNMFWCIYHMFIISHVYYLNSLKTNYKRYSI
ncbi:MAG: Cellulose synthase (UDP-forming) [Parcubacteria group bacterium GW2011_GWF2_38_8]|nr:MAG: Cellulose synthase (UDP-forming) [Parcubacteria group bacterium GW2011_GWF2_38_8]